MFRARAAAAHGHGIQRQRIRRHRRPRLYRCCGRVEQEGRQSDAHCDGGRGRVTGWRWCAPARVDCSADRQSVGSWRRRFVCRGWRGLAGRTRQSRPRLYHRAPRPRRCAGGETGVVRGSRLGRRGASGIGLPLATVPALVALTTSVTRSPPQRAVPERVGRSAPPGLAGPAAVPR